MKSGVAPGIRIAPRRDPPLLAGHVRFQVVGIAFDEVVARLILGHDVLHVLVGRLGDVLQQRPIGLHLIDRRLDDGVEHAFYQTADEAWKIDLGDGLAQRADACVRRDRAALAGEIGAGGVRRRLVAFGEWRQLAA